MELINKDALVAEIERIEKSIGSDRFLSEYERGCNQGKEDVCDTLHSFLDTLEVKEVDLESEMESYFIGMEVQAHENIFEDTFKNIAKHFFELGLKVQKGE